MTKVSLITGITGQDGSYLAELLLDKNYEVWGMIRRASDINTKRIEHLYNNKKLYIKYGDMTDGANFLNLLFQIKEKYGNNLEVLEIYNLAAMSHVKVSFEMPEYTTQTDGVGVLKILEAIRVSGIKEKTRFYQASTSEMYGKVQEVPQKETTPFYPRSPYGISKLYAYWITKNYREAYNMYTVNGILFNHESPRRGPTFVTRKITRGLKMILNGEREKLELGNLYSKRDWGHAKDYVEGMWRMLQSDNPDDYILSTNEFHSVKEFVEKAFGLRGFNICWKGDKENEIGYDKKTDRVLITVNPIYYRPAEVEELIGDSSKARNLLGWKTNYSFDDLVKEMVDHDCPL
jgi:GDPmannose 4,6-dehydratase